MILIAGDASPAGVIITILSIIGGLLFLRAVFSPKNKPYGGDSGDKTHRGSFEGRDRYER